MYSKFTFESTPLAVIHSFTNEDCCLVFNTREGQLLLSTCVEEIQAILNNSYGQKSVQEIALSIANLTPDQVLEVCNYLFEQKILIDSRELYLQFQIDSSNPPNFYYSRSFNDIAAHTCALQKTVAEDLAGVKILDPEINLLQSIILNRISCRNFSEKILSFRHISSILQVCTELKNTNSIPHAGGINSLSIYVAIHKSSEHILAGMYIFNNANQILSKLSDLNTTLLVSCLDAENIFPESGMTIFVTSSFILQGYKYANRAYRNSYIEAGHVSQNVQLYCAEENLAVLEYSGFQDEPCAHILGIQFPIESVLIVLFVGEKSDDNVADEELINLQSTVSKLKEAYLGNGKVLKSFSTTMLKQDDYYFPNIVFDGRYGLPHDDNLSDYRNGRAFATSMSHNWAFLKGCAEAIERYSASQMKSSCISTATNLDSDFIHPYVATPWHKKMFEWKGLTEFSSEMEIEWAKGYNPKTGQTVYAVVESVFYPLYSSRELGYRKLVTECNSSGVAAHFNKDEAIKRAMFELIERDALMVTWFSKKSCQKIPKDFLDQDTQIRTRHWEKQSYNCSFLDITIGSFPTVVCLIWSETKHPAIVSGACSSSTLATSIKKSLDEAEFQLMSWNSENLPITNFDEVRTPQDHALVWANHNMLSEIKWLLDSPESNPVLIETNCDPLAAYNPKVFILKEPSFENDFWVVRVIEESLLPINFGYRYEHFGHSRIESLGLTWVRNYPAIPHFFA